MNAVAQRSCGVGRRPVDRRITQATQDAKVKADNSSPAKNLVQDVLRRDRKSNRGGKKECRRTQKQHNGSRTIPLRNGADRRFFQCVSSVERFSRRTGYKVESDIE